jgi:hypothetical protein
MATWDEFADRMSAVLSMMPLGAGLELHRADRPLDQPFVTIQHVAVSFFEVIRSQVRQAPGRPFSEVTVRRLTELGWRLPETPHADLRMLLPDGSTAAERAPVVAAIVGLFEQVQQLPAPDALAYRAWYGGPDQSIEEITVSQLGLDHLRVEHFARLGPGDTTTDPGELFRVIRAGTAERVYAKTRAGGDWSPTELPSTDPPGQRVVPFDEFRARYVAARWSGSRFRFSRSLGANLDHRGQPVAEPSPESPADPALLDYLRSAPLISDHIGPEPDPFAPDELLPVPRELHTDGVWIWPESLGYLAERLGVRPEPDLMRHIAANGSVVPEVSDADCYAAYQLIFG